MNIRFHILIIDDNVDNIQVAINILREDGYELMLRGLELLQFSKSLPNGLDI